MKRVLLMLAATAAFACTTALAQAGGTAGTGNGGGAGDAGSVAAGQANTTHHHKGGASDTMDNMGKKGKSSTLTGCVSSSPGDDGMYTLSNGRYKKGVEIGPTDKVKDHAGHQVALKGSWSTAAAAGEAPAAAGNNNEKGERHFEVDSVKHLSDTCSTAPGGGTKGKKGKADTAAPPSK